MRPAVFRHISTIRCPSRFELYAGSTRATGSSTDDSAPQIECNESGWPDLNWRPLRPERSALPSCATARGAKASGGGAPLRGDRVVVAHGQSRQERVEALLQRQPVPIGVGAE